jgi:hypothetical protein
MAASLVAFLWLCIVCGSLTFMRFVVHIAPSASCLALLKPIKGPAFGSHSSFMFRLGYEVMSLPSLFRCWIAVSCSLCGEALSALPTAELEGRRR